MSAKEEFIELFKTLITRPGSEKCLKYLESSNFFDDPASTRYHSANEGGLCSHSINVYKRLLRLVETEYGPDWEKTISHESVAICGLLHDICKCNTYKIDFRNVKEEGMWVKKPYYAVEDKFPYGHGEKSVFMIERFFELSYDEAMMINWHMGPYDMRVKGGSFALSDVFYMYPNALLMYMADLQASYLDETTEKYASLQKK